MNIIPAGQLPPSEPDDAARYWADRKLRRTYTRHAPYRSFMAERVLAERPGRVLEFGANAGRNLVAIRDAAASKRRKPPVLKGVDVNAEAVAYGVANYGLDLEVVDEAWLGEQPDDAWDVAFTVSVIDHLPKPNPVLRELARVATVLLLLEPWLGKEGKVRQEDVSGTSPYSYSWNYPRRLKALGLGVSSEPYALNDDPRTLGPHYVLYRA